MNDELWLDIPEYKNLYQVSNYGRIKSLNYRRTGKEHILKQTTNNYGYKLVMLYKDGKGLETIKYNYTIELEYEQDTRRYKNKGGFREYIK